MTKQKKEIYLDHAATTAVDPQVLRAMLPFLGKAYGNPSSLYQKGREAKKAIEDARKSIANLVNARPEEIVFTAGGTESDNLAIFGLARNIMEHNSGSKPLHIITTLIEHHAVLEPCAQLEKEGFAVTYLKVDRQGFVNIEEIKKAVRPETILISVMYANNEVGAIEPIAEIGKWLKTENEKRIEKKSHTIYFHTDACQAAGALDINVQHLGVDLMTVNGSKIYGPKQSGFLFVRNGVNIKPIIYGGGQERNLRSGTENVAGIVGLAKALELAQKNRKSENERIIGLRDYFISRVKKEISGAQINGPEVNAKYLNRLPNNISFSFKGAEGEAMLVYLDARGICVSTGSACNANSGVLSHVLMAIGLKPELINSTLRFSLGKTTQKKDLDYTIKVLAEVVGSLRKVKGL